VIHASHVLNRSTQRSPRNDGEVAEEQDFMDVCSVWMIDAVIPDVLCSPLRSLRLKRPGAVHQPLA